MSAGAGAGGVAGGSAIVAWARGGQGRVVSIDARTIVVRSSVPSPPGSRIEGTLGGEPPTPLRMKVHGSKRQPEGDYVLEGRPIDMPRETRERLERLLGGEGRGPDPGS
jgi:hypothetical protein